MLTRRLLVALALLLAAGPAAPPAEAQYFGQNKVHYKSFDFKVLRTERFDIYSCEEGREGVDIAARMSERWLARLERRRRPRRAAG